jgi:GGDEF domain-containing protein
LISLKKNHGEASDELCNTLHLVVETLLHAIEVHSIPGDPDDQERFRADLQALRDAFAQTSTPAMLMAAGSAKRMLEDYNQQTARFLRGQTVELQRMFVNLAAAVAVTCVASEASVTHLHDLERHIAKASTIDEMRMLGVRLAECLETLRHETVRNRELAEQDRAQLKREAEASSQSTTSPASPQSRSDSLSGLPLRAQAESSLDTVIQAGGNGFVVAVVVDRVHLINARFGYGVGDKILALFREHLAQHLKAGDQIFRWTGPVFLVLMDRPNLPEGVRTEVRRITGAKLETTVQIGNRSVLLPVASAAEIFSLFEIHSAPSLIDRIDTFVAGHLRR